MNKKYSLVTITRNSDIINQLLADLILLDLTNMEQLIIVDNGSKKEFLSELKQTLFNMKVYYPELKYTILLREYNYLFSRSANYGIEYILNNSNQSQYIILVNPDISIHFNYWSNELNPFEEMIGQMIEYNADIAGAKLLYGNGMIEHAGGIDNDHRGRMYQSTFFDKVEEVEWVTGALMIIKTDLIKKIGFLDEVSCPHWVSDQEFCRRAFLIGAKVIYSPAYFVHSQGRSTEKESHDECQKDLPPGITWESNIHTLEDIKNLAIINRSNLPLKLNYLLED